MNRRTIFKVLGVDPLHGVVIGPFSRQALPPEHVKITEPTYMLPHIFQSHSNICCFPTFSIKKGLDSRKCVVNLLPTTLKTLNNIERAVLTWQTMAVCVKTQHTQQS